MLLPTVALTAARVAIEGGDAAAFAAVAAELGVALELGVLVEYIQRIERSKYEGVIGRALVEVIYAALYGEHGYGYECWAGSRSCLAVKLGDRVVLGMQACTHDAPFPKSGWKIARWFKDPARNRAAVGAWAEEPARATDALSIEIVRAPPTVDTAQGAALLAAVIADPDDDDARLVYADWLMDRGDVRGELIRIQCEVARAPTPELRARESVLLRDHRAALLGDVRSYAEEARFARGFIDHLTITAAELAKHARELVAAHPIRSIRAVVGSAEGCARLGTLDALAAEIAIEVRRRPKLGGPMAIAPTQIAASPIFARARRIGLQQLADDDAEWERFFATLVAPRLEALALVDNVVGPRWFDIVADAMAQLRELTIGEVQWGPDGGLGTADLRPAFERIAAWPQLTRVALAWNDGCELLPELLDSASLVSLRIANVRFDDDIFAALAASRLERLELLGVMRTDSPGLARIVRSRHLRTLELREKFATDAWGGDELLADALVAAPATLEQIDWPHCRLTPDEIARVRATRRLVF